MRPPEMILQDMDFIENDLIARLAQTTSFKEWWTLNQQRKQLIAERSMFAQGMGKAKQSDGTIRWITVNGAKVPIKDGQSKGDAVKEHIGDKKDSKPSVSNIPDDKFSDVAHLATKVPHVHPDDISIMSQFIDAVDSKDKEKLSGSIGDKAESLAEHWGISQDKGVAGIARGFKDVFEGKKKVKPTKKSFTEYWKSTAAERLEKADKLSDEDLTHARSIIAYYNKHRYTATQTIKALQSKISKLASQPDAARVYWTETKRDDTEAVIGLGEEIGFTKYKVVLSPSACPVCRKKTQDGSRVFKTAEVEKSGFGHAPPFHPNCYCILVPHVD